MNIYSGSVKVRNKKEYKQDAPKGLKTEASPNFLS